VVGIETDRGPWVQALVGSDYTVYPINPLQVARFRETERSSGVRAMPPTRTPWPTWYAPDGTR
jgi:hypothetical protein